MRFSLLVTASLFIGRLGSQTSPGAALSPLPNPAQLGSRLPFLTALPSGEIAMSWVEAKDGSPRQFLLATFKDGQWSKSQSIATDERLMLNWADFPSISASGSRIAAHWLERAKPGDGSYHLKIALNASIATKWETVFEAPAQTLDGYTGFLSFANFGNRWFATYLHNKPSGTSLRMAQINQDGQLLKEEVLDEDVCSCCQTSAAVTEDGPILVYRDHEQGQIRDISVIRHEKGTWTKPTPLHRDGWEINACPVNGPSIAARGKFVAVAWYTAAQGNPRVLLATSNDSGRSFSPPVRVDGGKPLGRVSIALSDSTVEADRFAAVTWLERLDQLSASVQVRALLGSSRLSQALEVGNVSSGRLSGFPRIAIAGDTLLLAWTADSVKTLEMPLAKLRAR